jgi:hypothetical protein
MAVSLDGTRLYAEVLSFHRIDVDPQHRNRSDQSNHQTKAERRMGTRGRQGGVERERDLGGAAGVDEYWRPGRTGATVSGRMRAPSSRAT